LAPVGLALALAGCGSSGQARSQASRSSTEPAYISEPFSHQQQLIGQGARLVVSDGCSACHLATVGRKLAPSFMSFAGHRVTLADGRRVIVDERFLREALRDSSRDRLAGYAPELMRKAAMRLRLASPQEIAALAAFIEQIGPEPAPG
jgi:cytochrome c2